MVDERFLKDLFGENFPFLLYEEVSSTNDIAKEILRKSDQDISLIISKKQSAGRGTKGRLWFSPAGMSLYTSIILRDVEANVADLSRLPVLYGALIKDILQKSCISKIVLKEPNDILIDGRKVIGILCESCVMGEVVKGAIVGIGVNLFRPTFDVPDDLSDIIGFLGDHINQGINLYELYKRIILAAFSVFSH